MRDAVVEQVAQNSADSASVTEHLKEVAQSLNRRAASFKF